MRKRTRAREYALQLLYQHEMNEKKQDDFLEDNLDAEPEVRDYPERLVKGTLERVADLDQIISRHAENWQLHRMAVIDRNILRFAAYELLYMTAEIPPKVAINEAVNIAKKFSQEEAGKFVNGILDKINHTERAQKAEPNQGLSPLP